MTTPPPDGSRDRRIEDPSNLWLIHPAARALLPRALALGLSANAVSIIGLCLGAGAAAAYSRWAFWPFALVGLVLSVGWQVADGLDGMIARATGTASPLGRFLDGVCDHGVFALIYVVLAMSVGTLEGWALAILAGVAHAVQSSLYEGERARFHRRMKGVPQAQPARPSGGFLVRLYDSVAGSIDLLAMPFERAFAAAKDRRAFAAAYARRAVPALRVMALLTANVRVLAIFVACLAGRPQIFWWFEIVPLTIVTIVGLAWHRHGERLATPIAQPSVAEERPAVFAQEQGQS